MKNWGKGGVLYLAVGGLFVAAGTFLVLFFTSSRASTPTQVRNLRIPPMSQPPRPKIPPLQGQATVTTASPLGIPQPSEEPIGSDSAEFIETESLIPSPESTVSGESLSQ